MPEAWILFAGQQTKSASAPDRLVGQVGSGSVDHASWQRLEDVAGPSQVFVLDPGHPGSDIAGSMAASLAQSYLLFKSSDPALAC
jgi:hypothetical protein